MVISRRQVEQSGIGSVLRELKPLLATREDTWLYRGPMPLVVDGYNEDPHELVDILQVRAFRRDVLLFIAAALQTFKKLGPEKRKAIALEIALLGRSGLDINDPADEYTLKSLPCVATPARDAPTLRQSQAVLRTACIRAQPHIRFLFIVPRFRLGEPKHPTSRRRTCPLANLRLYMPGTGTFTRLDSCHARHTRRS